MSSHDFRNDATWNEKVDHLKAQRPSTFFQEQLKARRLDGSTNYEAQRSLIQSGESAVVEYPRLPASSPWSGDPVGIEPPTGVAIDHMKCTGTPAEQAASLSSMVRIDEASESTNHSNKPATALAALAGPAPAGVAPVSSVARAAEPPCDPTVAAGSVPPAASSPAVDRGGSAVPSADRLSELLDRGLVRRTVKRRRL